MSAIVEKEVCMTDEIVNDINILPVSKIYCISKPRKTTKKERYARFVRRSLLENLQDPEETRRFLASIMGGDISFSDYIENIMDCLNIYSEGTFIFPERKYKLFYQYKLSKRKKLRKSSHTIRALVD